MLRSTSLNIVLILILASSCWGTSRRTKSKLGSGLGSGSNTDSVSAGSDNFQNPIPFPNPQPSPTATIDNGGGSNTNPGPDPSTLGYENCNVEVIAPYSSSYELGPIRFCLNRLNETQFRVRIDNIHVSQTICFVPLNKSGEVVVNNQGVPLLQGNGDTIPKLPYYLGSAQCTFNQNENQILDGNFVKNNFNQRHRPINAVMILVQDRVPLLFQCLDSDQSPVFQQVNSGFYEISEAYLCNELFYPSGGYYEVNISNPPIL